MPNSFLLACESSCDETAFAVYDLKNNKLISSVVYSQIKLHEKFNGVVPEIASKEHLNKIQSICEQALKEAEINITDINYFAATNGPGLPGALLIGCSFTKALAWKNSKPFIPINHLAGHIYSPYIEKNPIFPQICISASGGHTSLYFVKNEIDYKEIGTTLDDAAGECLDKISKILRLGYPGGAIIEKYAKDINFLDSRRYPRLKNKDLTFSFSGLKTAVLYDIIKMGYYDKINKQIIKETPISFVQSVASSLLCSISDIFCERIELAIKRYPEVKSISFVGGVSCNLFIKSNINKITDSNKLIFFSPLQKYCCDNAAMIALVASYIIKNNRIENNGYDSIINI
jgi:N6-L-threonylcarbamoyladenine synthase